VVAGLVDGLVELVPTAAGALVSAFTTPILGAIAGSVTHFVLKKLQGK
jgi:ammonia channel protein AmtB